MQLTTFLQTDRNTKAFASKINQSTECTDGEAMRECFRLIVSFLFA